MFKKAPFAIGLIVFGAILGSLGVVTSWFDNQQMPVVYIFLGVGISMVILGSILGLTQFLDHIAKPVVEEIADDVADDVEDIKAGRITWVLIQCILTMVAAIVFVLLVLRYHKLEATWSWMPVWVPAVIVVGILSWIVSRTDWFNDHSFETPWWVFVIPLAGLVISTFLGINRTENLHLLDFNYQNTEGYNSYVFSNNYFLGGGSQSWVPDINMPSCSGKSCEGEALIILLIALVVLTIVLIVGSAFIPNFWLLAGTVFLVVMIIIATQRLLVRPYRGRRYQH